MSGPPGSAVVETKKRKRGGQPAPAPALAGSLPPDKQSSQSKATERSQPAGITRDASHRASTAALPFPSRDGCLSEDGAFKPQKHFASITTSTPSASSPISYLPFRPRGVLNAANFCYVAAVMQSLIHCPPFAHVCATVGQGSGEEKATAPTAYLLGQWMLQYWKASTSASTVAASLPAPRLGSCSSVKLASTRTADGLVQEDAHELLISILSAVADEVEALGWYDVECAARQAQREKEMKKAKQAEKDSGGGGKWTLVGKGNEKLTVRAHKEENPGRIFRELLFNGTIRSHLKGAKGVKKGVTSVSVEPFTVLPLDIGLKPKMSIEEAFTHFATKERVAAVDDADGDMKKCTFLGDLPTVLVIQLQRYVWTQEGEMLKLDNLVTFGTELIVPHDALDSSIHGGGKGKGTKALYDLQSVICHRGNSPNTGHYVCYVPISGAGGKGEEQFLLCNDAKTSTGATLADVQNDTPYLLFFQRR